MPIDFQLSDDQLALQATARSFATDVMKDIRPLVNGISDPMERFTATRPHHKAAVEAGLVNGLFPKEFGGSDVSTLDFALAAEEFCTQDVSLAGTLLGTGLGTKPLIWFGTEEQKKRFLPDFIEDGTRLAALAFTDTVGGANFDSPDPSCGVQTFARLEGDEWVINGQKHYTTNGSGWDGKGCHLFAVVCRTDPSKGAGDSLAIIMVPGATPGISVDGILEPAGHKASIAPRIHFDNVRVPASNILGQPGDGVAMVTQNFAWTAALIGAACVGVMRSAFEIARDWACRDTRSGPHPVIDYPVIGYKFADMKMKIEACRYMTWKACQQFDLSGGKEQELAVMTKVFTSETCVDVVYDAMKIVGVDSYQKSHPLMDLMNDALCFPLYDGGNMGARRRQLHGIIKSPGYDPLTAPFARY
ncbi:acyl-CoA dehydrogenase family protein [Mangrovicoccus sp. HB161399]|uniref:acyl-CoA dehydrogenase family protein n=1 Tax=Mangrovicoccus sp. HB161399 TaxID=2720392 RepID=UPI001552EF23|nr:acyl-CoA dehydrogenase family protein [Mangrovicoccus sp. HB161399]